MMPDALVSVHDAPPHPPGHVEAIYLPLSVDEARVVLRALVARHVDVEFHQGRHAEEACAVWALARRVQNTLGDVAQ